MKRPDLAALLALLALPLAGSALAQEATGARVEFEATTGPVTVVSVQPPLPNADDYRVTIADLDADHDGRLSRAEVPADQALAAEFDLVDRNRNGRITAAELEAWK